MYSTFADLIASGISGKTKVVVVCEEKISPKCRNQYQGCYRDLVITGRNHGDKITCFHCSRIKKATRGIRLFGAKNPNRKYIYDDTMFSVIDSEAKAYLLGWIASDGSVGHAGITLSLKTSDSVMVKKLANLISPDLPTAPRGYGKMLGFTVNSKVMAMDVCKWLKINPGKKSEVVQMPDLPKELLWHFIRGYFEGDGCVNLPECDKYPKCDIASNSKLLRQQIKEFCGIPCSNSDNTDRIYWCNNNALDFLGHLYENANVDLTLQRKRERYLDWCNWVPSLNGPKGKHMGFCWNKTVPEAQAPCKTKVSDSGFDLTLLSIWKKTGLVTYYDTGIKIQPDYGWYFMLVARSSLTKTGYILANSVGIIDRTYIGTIKVPLIKLDPNAPDLELPAKLVQIIPNPIIHPMSCEVEVLDETARNEGGFGSTDKK